MSGAGLFAVTLIVPLSPDGFILKTENLSFQELINTGISFLGIIFLK